MSQQHVRFVLLGLVWLCASLAAADGRGLYYGNPTSGGFQFVDLSSGQQSYFADTYVSHPTAVALYKNQTYFANFGPLSKQPWISFVPISGDKKATLFSQDDTPTGVFIGDMAIDPDYQSGSLFFLYRDMEKNANRESQDNPWNVIFTKPLDSATGTSATAVYAMDSGTAPPNFIALDTANQFIYFSSNGLVNTTKSQRTLGGIYKVPYTGGSAELILPLPELANMQSSILSLKFYNNHLYYILNSVSDRTIRKVDLTNAVNSVICDKLPYIPLEIELDINNDRTTLWIRDSQGKFYRISDSSCTFTSYFTLPHVVDFVYEDASKKFYSVNSDVAAVLSFGTDGKPSAVASGIGKDTNIWVDNANRILYYATYNRIDSFTIEDTPTWNNVYKLPASDRVEDLAGNDITGDLVIATQNGVYSWSPRGQQGALLLPVHATSITVQNSTLYYATNSSDTYSVMRCDLEGCSPSTARPVVSNVAKSIDTVSVGNDGSLFYGTTDGLFKVSDNIIVVPYLATISPYAMFLRSKQLTYLDINGNDVIIGTCNIDECRATLNTTTAHFTRTTRVETYAFMECDPNGLVYWSTSLNPGVVYRFDSTNATANITNVWKHMPEGPMRGMALSEDGSNFYASLNTDVWIFSTTSFDQGTVCIPGQNVSVGALEVYGSSIFWADSRTGTVFQCNSDCSGCTHSSWVNSGSTVCGNWQTLSVQKKLLYEQEGCGGVARVAYNNSQRQLQTLRSPGQYPFTDMVTGEKGLLAFAVPFRATIRRANAGAAGLVYNSTALTGTGLFTDLVVDQSSGSNTYYWNDPAARKLLTSKEGSVSELTFEFALGLSYFVPSEEAPSSSPTPSSTMSVRPSSAPTVSATSSMSASGSASASGSVSVTSTSTMSASETPSGSMSPSWGSSPSDSSTRSASLSASPSATMTSTSTATPSLSMSLTSGNGSVPTAPSASVTTSPSASLSLGALPTHTFLPFLNGSASNTPGLANQTEPIVSPLISTTGWEWIGLISLILIVCVIIPCSYCTWKKNVEQEMAMSLRLP